MKAVLIVIVLFIALAFAGIAYYFYDANTKAQNELQAKNASVSEEKEKEIATLKGTYDDLVTHMKKEIEEGQVKVVQLSDRLSVIMAERVMFPPGEAEISYEGFKILEQVGKVLKTTQRSIIRVEGHTDNEETKKLLQKKYATNWELSTARATNVVRFLQEKIGIDPKFLQPIGMSEYHPVASNETADGRRQNRRIEITLLP